MKNQHQEMVAKMAAKHQELVTKMEEEKEESVTKIRQLEERLANKVPFLNQHISQFLELFLWFGGVLSQPEAWFQQSFYLH